MSPFRTPIPGYEFLRPLGDGGMGEVHLARQVSLDRVVAVKVLTTGPRDDPAERVERFRREAALMARIEHPHIVSVYDFGDVDGRPYLVMEYVAGSDLRHAMTEGRPMAVERVRSLIAPLAEALDCLHGHDVLHRDFKPENILIKPPFTPKVSDFGIAVASPEAGSLTGDDRWMGTIGYVAPEQQYRLKVDARADQFSMAAVMYELLTGQRPLGVFKPPSRLNPGLDDRVDAVLMRALQEDREDRFATIPEFAAALEAALASRPRRRGGWGRGLKVLAALVVALVIARWLFARPGGPRWQNDLAMEFVEVPAGEFAMGSPETDPLAGAEEKPSHRVKISRPFWMGTREVTVREFRAFVRATGYRTEAEATGLGGHAYDFKKGQVVRSPTFVWTHPRGEKPAGDDEPVTQVTWRDAVAFCDWLSRREGRKYGLPTEAQWEYACRAGGGDRWCAGDDPSRLDAYAWTIGNALGTRPVGRKRPNRFGLFDMHGNVWEWCLDPYGPYAEGTVVDPAGPPSGDDRVVRGGSWDWDDVARTRSAARLDSRPDYAYFTYGFRVCVDRPGPPPPPARPR